MKKLKIEESLEQSINPLSGLVEEDIDSGEFGLWSNSMKLLDNSRYSEAAENLRLLILSYPNGTYTGDAYFWLGEIYLVQEMFEDSSEILNAFSKDLMIIQERQMACINLLLPN